MNAAGGTAGQYRWYTVATGSTAIAGQTNGSHTTPSLTISTTYYVALNNGTCEGNRTIVTATINPVPVAPTTTGNSRCGNGTVTLNAVGGTADNMTMVHRSNWRHCNSRTNKWFSTQHLR
ncbi:MAG: hypothetical protein U5K54_19320 [Cytophagales bacterium]|nr:hypothetical protein [Cytophagales bacterium]